MEVEEYISCNLDANAKFEVLFDALEEEEMPLIRLIMFFWLING